MTLSKLFSFIPSSSFLSLQHKLGLSSVQKTTRYCFKTVTNLRREVGKLPKGIFVSQFKAPSPQPRYDLLQVGIFMEAVFIVVATVSSVTIRGVLPLGTGFFNEQIAQLRLAFLCFIPFTAMFGILSFYLDITSVEVFKELFERRARWQIVPFCLTVAVAEELFFRGFLQATIATLVHSNSIALVTASIIFGILHSYSLKYTVLATLAGFCFGVLYYIGGESVLVPIVVHGLYDVIAVIFLLFQWKYADTQDKSASVWKILAKAFRSTGRDKS